MKTKTNKTLVLHLKKKWFDMIKAGIKKAEYREINDYWMKRLWNSYEYDYIEFCLGYPKKNDKQKRIRFKNPRWYIDTGKQEWGAEPGKNYIIIIWD